jgi:hypothetical protein
MVNDSTAMDLARDVCVQRSNEQITDREACALIHAIVADSGRLPAGEPDAVAAPAIVLPADLVAVRLGAGAGPPGRRTTRSGRRSP